MNVDKMSQKPIDEESPVVIFLRVSPGVAASLEKEAAKMGLTRPNLVKTIIYKHVNGIVE